jgi:hypothetical protein
MCWHRERYWCDDPEHPPYILQHFTSTHKTSRSEKPIVKLCITVSCRTHLIDFQKLQMAAHRKGIITTKSADDHQHTHPFLLESDSSLPPLNTPLDNNSFRHHPTSVRNFNTLGECCRKVREVLEDEYSV